MATYRKLPVEIEAFQWWGDERQAEDPEWIVAAIKSGRVRIKRGPETRLIIQTLEGEMEARPGNYILLGVAGEIYPCRSDIFEKTYELVGERT